MTISRKLTMLIVIAALGSLAVMAVQLMSLRSTIWSDRKDFLQAQVQSAVSVLKFYADEAAAGRLTEEEAKLAARNAVRAMRYGKRAGGRPPALPRLRRLAPGRGNHASTKTRNGAERRLTSLPGKEYKFLVLF